MAGVLHGVASWPGVVSVSDCTYTCSQGISPGMAVLTCLPQLLPPSAEGTLLLSDGNVTIPLPGCKVQRAIDHKDPPYGETWTLEILDRRWRWRETGSISGQYNQKDKHNYYYPWTVRTPTQLAALLLDAMGETGYEILLPDVGLPPCDWDHDNPAQLLSALCESLGCRVLYRIDTDSVLIAPVGEGGPLPTGGWSISKASPSFNAPAGPSTILLAGAPIRYQARFALQAVGLDWDGHYRPIEYLSYAPEPVLRPQIIVATPSNPDAGSNESFNIVVNALALNQDGTVTTTNLATASYIYTGSLSAVCNGLQQQLSQNAALKGWTVTSDGASVTVQGPPGDPFELDCNVTGAPDPTTALFAAKITQTALDGTNPWAQCGPPDFPAVRPTDRLTRLQAMELAQKSVFKMYALILLAPDRLEPLTVPGCGADILRTQQILLHETQVEQVVPNILDERQVYEDGRSVRQFYYDGYSRDMPAQCFGSYQTGIEAGGGGNDEDGNTDPTKEITVPFSIDHVWNVVQFSGYVWTNKSGSCWPADVTLQTACNVRDPVTNQVLRYEQAAPVPGATASDEPGVVKRGDVQLNWVAIYDPVTNQVTSLVNDLPLAQTLASIYLGADVVKWLPAPGSDIEYNGLVPIPLDGAVQQVTWSVGGGGARTRASLNMEHAIHLPTLPMRRWLDYLPSFADRQRFASNVNGAMQWDVPDRINQGGQLARQSEV